MIERTVTIRGREEDVATVLKLLRHMEYLGASRNIVVRVDGDGYGRIHVTDENGEKLDNARYSTEQFSSMGAIVEIYDIG